MHQRLDELVGLAPLVGRLHREHRMLDRRPQPVHHRVVGQPGPVPPAVPVHREVAADESGDIHLASGDAPHVHQKRPNHLGTRAFGAESRPSRKP